MCEGPACPNVGRSECLCSDSERIGRDPEVTWAFNFHLGFPIKAVAREAKCRQISRFQNIISSFPSCVRGPASLQPTVQFLETRLATSFGSSKGRTPTESGVAPTSKNIRVGADKHKGEA